MTWYEALREVVLAFQNQPPRWGEHDCCQFIARYVEKVSGINHAAGFAYGSKDEALRLLIEYGGIEGLISKCLGPLIEKEQLKPGDVVLCSINVDAERGALVPGITNGHYVFAVHPEHGLSRAPLAAVVGGWSCRS